MKVFGFKADQHVGIQAGLTHKSWHLIGLRAQPKAYRVLVDDDDKKVVSTDVTFDDIAAQTTGDTEVLGL